MRNDYIVIIFDDERDIIMYKVNWGEDIEIILSLF